MNNINVTVIVCLGIAAVALVIFLIWKNNKDRKELDADETDAVD